MHPFASYVLRSYYKATGWNEDNLYANLTRSSSALLDFTVPHGLHFSVSKSPNALFKTTYAMTAMPSLHGSVGYIFTSCDLDVKSSGNVRFKDMIERFKVYDQPRRPETPEEEWLAGELVRKRDYLLYGRFFLPTGRLDALYSTRLTPTIQASISAISDPPSLRGQKGDMSNVMINLQHDVGKWCSEYTWSAEDEMWGVRVLHNFGKIGGAGAGASDVADDAAARGRGVKRVDEEDGIEGGLKGRVSVGGEFYFSAKERSAGVSTGIRFTTLPDATPPSFQIPTSSPTSPLSSSPLSHARGPPFQPPTTITALFNPMLGHISSAYTARVSPDLALSSRFDFNVYSFESEWAMGVEWWLRRPPTVVEPSSALPSSSSSSTPSSPPSSSSESAPPSLTTIPSPLEVNGVVKARASTNNDVSLMWEGRLRNMLVSLGVVSDLSSRSKPIKSLGLEVAFFSSE
ncbi:mitochondrial distribution and morphology protein 10 [Pholiota conissans]|uniref:Mitochondrial distribution and morphology protein 10 n=1 Tax=Pholiota conissans TaxID=109636 RepID=A0A9P5YQS0_9AGAR|nr:mitochondrial distribution and morphology protein 10 [Pholiota conissans]